MSFASRAAAGTRRMINRLSGTVTFGEVTLKCAVLSQAGADVLLAGGGGDVSTTESVVEVMKADLLAHTITPSSDDEVTFAGLTKAIKTIAGAEDPDNPALTLLLGDPERD